MPPESKSEEEPNLYAQRHLAEAPHSFSSREDHRDKAESGNNEISPTSFPFMSPLLIYYSSFSGNITPAGFTQVIKDGGMQLKPKNISVSC